MIMQDPADGVGPPQRPCRARDGVLVDLINTYDIISCRLLFIYFDVLYCLAVDIYVYCVF